MHRAKTSAFELIAEFGASSPSKEIIRLSFSLSPALLLNNGLRMSNTCNHIPCPATKDCRVEHSLFNLRQRSYLKVMSEFDSSPRSMYDRGDESGGNPVIVSPSRSHCLATLAKHSRGLADRLVLRVREKLGAAISYLFFATTIFGQDLCSFRLSSIKQDRRIW